MRSIHLKQFEHGNKLRDIVNTKEWTFFIFGEKIRNQTKILSRDLKPTTYFCNRIKLAGFII